MEAASDPDGSRLRSGRVAAIRTVVTTSTPTAKVLSTVLVLTYVYAVLFPGGAADALALQPDKVVPRLWSLVTSSFYEWNVLALFIHVTVVFTLGQRVERVWGAREFVRFVLLVNASVGTATFVCMYVLYIASRDQYYLFTTFGGFQGVVAGLLVAWRQVAPEEPVGSTQLRAKHMLPLYVVFCLALAILSGAEHHHIGLYLFVVFGAYSAWVYLRFFQTVAHSSGTLVGASVASSHLRGDPRLEFSFASLWPEPMQACVGNVCSNPCYALCCTTRSAGAGGLAAAGQYTPHGMTAVEVYRATVDAVNTVDGVAHGRQDVLAQRGNALLEQRLAQLQGHGGDVEAKQAAAESATGRIAGQKAEEDAV